MTEVQTNWSIHPPGNVSEMTHVSRGECLQLRQLEILCLRVFSVQRSNGEHVWTRHMTSGRNGDAIRDGVCHREVSSCIITCRGDTGKTPGITGKSRAHSGALSPRDCATGNIRVTSGSERNVLRREVPSQTALTRLGRCTQPRKDPDGHMDPMARNASRNTGRHQMNDVEAEHQLALATSSHLKDDLPGFDAEASNQSIRTNQSRDDHYLGSNGICQPKTRQISGFPDPGKFATGAQH